MAKRIFVIGLVVGLLEVFMLSACTELSSWLRQHTYPPDFNYITQEQLHSTMWRLAGGVRELERTMRKPGEIDQERHAEILRLLASMQQTTAQLSKEGRNSNHPVIDANLPAFQRDISLARQGVERDPPNYTLVGLLPGACIYCHGVAR